MSEYIGLDEYRTRAAYLQELPTVDDATVIESDDRLDGEPSIEVLVGPGFDRVPPSVLRRLAATDLGTERQTSFHGDSGRYYKLVVR